MRPHMTAAEIKKEIRPHLADTPVDMLERMLTGLHYKEFKAICRIPSRRARQWEILDAIREIAKERES